MQLLDGQQRIVYPADIATTKPVWPMPPWSSAPDNPFLRPISMMFLTLLLVGIVSGVLGGLILALLHRLQPCPRGVPRRELPARRRGALVDVRGLRAVGGCINPYLGLLLIVPVAFAIGYFLHRWLIIRLAPDPWKTARSCSPSDC